MLWVEILTDMFELVMKLNATGNSRYHYWIYFLIVLKIKLWASNLNYRMHLPDVTVSRQFHEALKITAIRLKFLIQLSE